MANGPQTYDSVRAFDPRNPGQTVELTVAVDDVNALLDGPAHHVHELQHLVSEVVRKRRCRAVFRGLRQDGDLAEGLAYCGQPSRAFTNAGEERPPHDDMCFVVFVNDGGQIFDWDWVPCGNAFGLPVDWAQRFQEPLWLNLGDVPQGEQVSGGSKTLTFARLEDYQGLLCPALDLDDPEELEQFGAVVAQVQADWHRQGQNGCIFAQILSANRPAHGWMTIVVPRSGAVEAAAAIAEHTRAGVENSEVRVASFLLPWLTSEADLARLLKALGDSPGWSVEGTELDEAHTNLAVRLALEDGTVSSWVLGFGSFSFSPMTRRSPFVEIVVPVKPKVPGHHRMDDTMTVTHLADVPLAAFSDSKYEGMKKGTKRHRLFMLGGDKKEKRAKAKVTFTIPTAAWEAAQS